MDDDAVGDPIDDEVIRVDHHFPGVSHTTHPVDVGVFRKQNDSVGHCLKHAIGSIWAALFDIFSNVP
jgi:hypothetical protein